MEHSRLALLLLALALATVPKTSNALQFTWIDTCSSHRWDDPLCWNDGGGPAVPTPADDVTFGLSLFATRDIFVESTVEIVNLRVNPVIPPPLIPHSPLIRFLLAAGVDFNIYPTEQLDLTPKQWEWVGVQGSDNNVGVAFFATTPNVLFSNVTLTDVNVHVPGPAATVRWLAGNFTVNNATVQPDIFVTSNGFMYDDLITYPARFNAAGRFTNMTGMTIQLQSETWFSADEDQTFAALITNAASRPIRFKGGFHGPDVIFGAPPFSMTVDDGRATLPSGFYDGAIAVETGGELRFLIDDTTQLELRPNSLAAVDPNAVVELFWSATGLPPILDGIWSANLKATNLGPGQSVLIGSDFQSSSSLITDGHLELTCETPGCEMTFAGPSSATGPIVWAGSPAAVGLSGSAASIYMNISDGTAATTFTVPNGDLTVSGDVTVAGQVDVTMAAVGGRLQVASNLVVAAPTLTFGGIEVSLGGDLLLPESTTITSSASSVLRFAKAGGTTNIVTDGFSDISIDPGSAIIAESDTVATAGSGVLSLSFGGIIENPSPTTWSLSSIGNFVLGLAGHSSSGGKSTWNILLDSSDPKFVTFTGSQQDATSTFEVTGGETEIRLGSASMRNFKFVTDHPASKVIIDGAVEATIDTLTLQSVAPGSILVVDDGAGVKNWNADTAALSGSLHISQITLLAGNVDFVGDTNMTTSQTGRIATTGPVTQLGDLTITDIDSGVAPSFKLGGIWTTPPDSSLSMDARVTVEPLAQIRVGARGQLAVGTDSVLILGANGGSDPTEDDTGVFLAENATMIVSGLVDIQRRSTVIGQSDAGEGRFSSTEAPILIVDGGTILTAGRLHWIHAFFLDARIDSSGVLGLDRERDLEVVSCILWFIDGVELVGAYSPSGSGGVGSGGAGAGGTGSGGNPEIVISNSAVFGLGPLNKTSGETTSTLLSHTAISLTSSVWLVEPGAGITLQHTDGNTAVTAELFFDQSSIFSLGQGDYNLASITPDTVLNVFCRGSSTFYAVNASLSADLSTFPTLNVEVSNLASATLSGEFDMNLFVETGGALSVDGDLRVKDLSVADTSFTLLALSSASGPSNFTLDVPELLVQSATSTGEARLVLEGLVGPGDNVALLASQVALPSTAIWPIVSTDSNIGAVEIPRSSGGPPGWPYLLEVSFVSGCAVGYFDDGAGGCIGCPPGTFHDGVSTGNVTTACTACSPGTMNSVSGSTSCGDCADAFTFGYNPGFELPADHFWYPNSTTTCDVCPEGSGAIGFECLPCPTGTYGGPAGCEPCGLGSYGPSVGALICAQCEKDTYTPDVGQVACQACPNSTETSGTASQAITACLCVSGTYSKSLQAGTECFPCPEGGICLGGIAAPEAAPGWFPIEGSIDVFIRCVPPEACAGDGACAVGFTGEVCSSCEPGKYLNSDRCVECSAIPWQVALAVGIYLLFLYALFAFSSATESSYFAPVSIAFSFVQIVGLMRLFRLGWPEELLNIFDWLSVLNFDFDFFAPECLLPGWSWFYKYIGTLILPPATALLFLVFYGLAMSHANRTFDKTPDEVFNQVVNAMVMFLVLGYVSLSSTALSFFDCTEYTEDTITLDADPSISCINNPLYDRLFPVAVAGSAVYALGIPAAIWYVLTREKARLPEATYVERFSFLVSRYTDRNQKWELLIMLRKFAFVMAKLFFTALPLWGTILALLVLLASVQQQSSIRPYRKDRHNTLEVTFGWCAISILFSGLLLYTDKFNEKEDDGVVVFIAIALGVFFLVTVPLAVILEFRILYLESRGADQNEAIIAGRSKVPTTEAATFEFGATLQGFLARAEPADIKFVADGIREGIAHSSAGERQAFEQVTGRFLASQTELLAELPTMRAAEDPINPQPSATSESLFSRLSRRSGYQPNIQHLIPSESDTIPLSSPGPGTGS